jgi:N-acetylmuramidase-like protein/putative peptidoglycan binding protein
MGLNFTGRSTAVTAAGLARAAEILNVKTPELWTVLAVETEGCGFLPSRRPQMLYERHYFSRLTNHRYDDDDISSPQPGGYGMPGEPQYGRLARAIELNRDAALQSCSWGLGQIMGANYRLAGFANAEDMVEAMCAAEDAQLLAFARFLQATKLDTALRAHDWAALARGYNGPNYAINQYDVKLGAAYRKYSNGASPDLTARTAQLYLTYAGFNPGPVDGAPGSRTRNALQQYQRQKGLPVTGVIDDATMTALQPAA